MGFGFAATPELRWGVYRLLAGGERSWYCETFLEWMERVIAARGLLFDGGEAASSPF